MGSCAPPPDGISSNTLSGPSVRPALSDNGFLTRKGSRIYLPEEEGGGVFRAAGTNAYWLGLDENDPPGSYAYPSESRITEAIATVAAMGGNLLRAHTLSVSYGSSKSLVPNLTALEAGPDHWNQQAWEPIEIALQAAREYGVRVMMPLTDQYDYYHGSISTFLRFRSLPYSNPSSDFKAFYDVNGQVFQDFKNYVGGWLNHTNGRTGKRIGEDSAVGIIELGNELGSWNHKDCPPPVEWSSEMAKYIKSLAPNVLVMSGNYGVRKEELEGLGEEVDLVTNHFYPPYTSTLSSDLSLIHSHNKDPSTSKAYLIGEYNWTGVYWQRWLWFAILIPFVIGCLVWLMPKRWFPWRVPIPGVRPKRQDGIQGEERREMTAGVDDDQNGNGLGAFRVNNGSTIPGTPNSTTKFIGGRGEDEDIPLKTHSQQQLDDGDGSGDMGTGRIPLSRSDSQTRLRASFASSATFPPPPPTNNLEPDPNAIPSQTSSGAIPASGSRFPSSSSSSPRFYRLPIYRLYLSLFFILILCPITAIVVWKQQPSSLGDFLKEIEKQGDKTLDSGDDGGNGAMVGDLWWSLFGHDGKCCAWIAHNDGFTLHYPGTTSSMRSRTLTLTHHAYKVTQSLSTPNLTTAVSDSLKLPRSVNGPTEMKEENLPGVMCPQRELANATQARKRGADEGKGKRWKTRGDKWKEIERKNGDASWEI